jgi:single-strand DNA-binding protein
MAQSLNKVMLLGNLGADPDFKTFENGDKICNLSVATNVSWKEPHGETWHERTEWHQISVKASNLVTLCERKAHKGAKVFLEGTLETRSWQDSLGNKRWATEIILRPYRSELKILTDTGQRTASGPGFQQTNTEITPDEVIPF